MVRLKTNRNCFAIEFFYAKTNRELVSLMSNDPIRRVIATIPGYGGYREREIRRESDKLIRLRVLSVMSYVSYCLEDTGRDAYHSAESGGLYALADRVRAALQLLETYVRSLESGYAPLYSQLKINEDKLDSLIRYDETLLEKTERLREEAKGLKLEPELEIDATRVRLHAIEALLKELDDYIHRRQELFLT
jgi:hypothetical protein